VLDVGPRPGGGIGTIDVDAVAARLAPRGRERSYVGEHRRLFRGGPRAGGSSCVPNGQATNMAGAGNRSIETNVFLFIGMLPRRAFDVALLPRPYRFGASSCGPDTAGFLLDWGVSWTNTGFGANFGSDTPDWPGCSRMLTVVGA